MDIQEKLETSLSSRVVRHRHAAAACWQQLAAQLAGGVGEIKSLQYMYDGIYWSALVWKGAYSTKKGRNHYIQYLSSAFKARQSHLLRLPVGTWWFLMNKKLEWKLHLKAELGSSINGFRTQRTTWWEHWKKKRLNAKPCHRTAVHDLNSNWKHLNNYFFFVVSWLETIENISTSLNGLLTPM